MKRQVNQWLLALGLFSALVTALAPATAAQGELNLVSLAMHRETGRDIYLGALRSEKLLVDPSYISSSAGARAMEFRIAARRTSIRSLLGGILLQAEVANGAAPPPAVVDFANNTISAVKGSLYTGDSLVLNNTARGDTVAMVDGQELARSSAPGVFDYFLSGWIGERGPSTDFRDSLLAEDIDVDLRASYGALMPSPERIAAVTAWGAPEPAASQPATPQPAAPEPATPSEPPEEEKQEQLLATAEPEPATTEPAEPEQAAPQPAVPEPAASEAVVAAAGNSADSADSAPNPEATAPTLAMAQVTPELPEESSPASALAEETEPADPYGVAALSVIEYSQQLARFNNLIFRLVNTKIRYPRSAIRRNIEGRLELDITLNRGGEMLDVVVARSSGEDLLDEAALKAAKKAFKNPITDPLGKVALAEYSDGNLLVVPVPVNFVLTD